MSKPAKRSQKDRPFLCVEWADAFATSSTWQFADEIDDTGEHLVRSSGWLLMPGSGGQSGHISLAQSVGPEQSVDHIINIPIGMIRKIHRLSLSGAVSATVLLGLGK